MRSAARMSTEQLIKVFVYGTLKRGEPNHHWLTRPENGVARFLTAAQTAEKYPLVVGTRYNIPFVVDKRGVGYHVRGEVYEVDEQMLAKLDELEDYPSYYDRQVETVLVNGEDKGYKELQCWFYLIRHFPDKLLQKTHLESYHNTEGQLYCERSQRDEQKAARDDMAY